MTTEQDTPLISTMRGNLPIASLTYETRWEDTPTYTKFIETYRLDGDVVRESAHVYMKVGLGVESQAAELG